MSVGFGFSVTDFIGAIKLVGTVIDALSASNTNSSELQELYQQLRNLETTLRNIEHLEADDSLHAEVIALKQSAAQCQPTITKFLRRTQPYEAHLLCTNGGTRNLHSEWNKVKWALCKKKHVIQFKIDLSIHVQYIQLPLTMIQMRQLELGQKRQQETQKSVVSQFQQAFMSCMRELSVISKTLIGVPSLAHECVNNSRRILRMQFRVFQSMLDLQRLFMTVIPAQVQRQQPVYLIDALGRYTPFFLETIRSPAALISVLSDNSSCFGSASRKILKEEFTIQDTRTKKDINLVYPLDDCFVPGQQVEMCMLFEGSTFDNTLCPRCWFNSTKLDNNDKKCGNCDLIFGSTTGSKNGKKLQDGVILNQEHTGPLGPSRVRPEEDITDDEDLSNYHRIRVRATPAFLPRATRSQMTELFIRMYSPDAEGPNTPSKATLSEKSINIATESAKKLRHRRAFSGYELVAKAAQASVPTPPESPLHSSSSSEEPSSLELTELRDIAITFAKKLPEETFTSTEIQGFLLTRKNDPVRALCEVDVWRDQTIAAKEKKEADEGGDFNDEALVGSYGSVEADDDSDD
ncbi:MAG: hypothetical protein Q9215_006198 [Flavoplaca cf. flavocitrina]